ncbi:MAG: DUF4115 domain-containing protein [Halanaerobacter sp.]
MEELGAKFKEKREELDITLAQARNETNIRMSYLEAIEEGEFGTVEQEVYLKGFLKIYANYLGLDERKILKDYRGYKKKEDEHEEASDLEQEENNQSFGDKIKGFFDYHQNKFLYALIAIAVLLIILAVLFLGTMVYKSFIAKDLDSALNVESYVNKITGGEANSSVQKSSERKEKNGSSQQESINQQQIVEQDKEAEKEEQSALQEEQKQIELKLKAIAKSWCAVEENGDSVFRGIMEKGSSKEFRAKNIRLKIGNAAGIKVVKNGEELGPFGQTGEVVVKEYSIKSN